MIVFTVDKKFDLVAMMNLIEHVEDLVPIVQRARTLLKPDGKLLITAPTWLDKTCLELVSFGPFNFVDDNAKKSVDEHKNYYTKKSM